MRGRPYSTTRAALNRAHARGARRGIALGLAGSFDSAKVDDRLRDRRVATLATPNAHRDQWTRERLVRACQDLYRNNIVARAFVRRDGEIVAGARPGLRLGSEDPAWNSEVAEMLAAWFTDGFDHEGVLTFGQFARVAVENEHRAGDGLLLLLKTGACQWVEGVRIKNPFNRQDTEDCVGGVRLDPTGRVLGYEIADWNAQGTMLTAETRFVPAESAIYVGGSRGREPGQRRGEPALSAVLHRMRDLEQLHTAVHKAQEMAAVFSLFITRQHPEASPLDYALTGDHGEDQAVIDRARESGEVALFPGSVTELSPGESIQTTDPKQPSTGYEAKLFADLKLISGDLGVPLELAFYHYTTNYAAARSAIVSAWKGVEARQEWLADRVLTPVVRWKIGTMIRRGEIRRVPGWQKVNWNLPGMPTLDLNTEVDAVTKGIAGGVMTRADAVARINGGMTVKDFYRERGEEIAEETRLGITTQQPSTVTLSVNQDRAADGGTPAP